MTSDWSRLGQFVRQRRNQLGLAQGAGGVSAATWRKIEKAVDPPYRTSTVLAVCRVLGWTPDSFDKILEGGDPVEIRPGSAASLGDDLEARVRALELEMGWVKLELAARDRDPAREPEPARDQPDDRTGGPGGRPPPSGPPHR